jgi:hypothetical protein
MEEQTKTDFVQCYADFLKSIIPIMMNWSIISRYQKMIYDNFSSMSFGNDLFHSFLQLAPSYLSQVINPWSFSLMQFTKEVKGSPELEYKILTRVDGYGGQLGTVIDYLEVLSEHLKLDNMSDEDTYKWLRFKNLAQDIKRIKEQ